MLFDANHTYTSEQITTFTGLWTEIIKHLSLHHDPKIICSFLNKCAIVSIDEKHKKLDIGVPNEFILSQAKKFFQKTLKEAIHSVYNQQYSYDLHIFIPFQNKVAHPLHIDLKKILKVTGTIETPTVAKENGLDAILHDAKTATLQSSRLSHQLNPQLTFNTIVGWAHIDFALNAARAVAETPGQVYNPLFLYGHVWLGKTHLLHAIGNAVHKYRADAKVVFVPTSALIDLIVLAIRKNQLPKLLTEFRQIDVLLLDDVQFLGDKEKTQEIFHNIFNEMHSAGKQIVITSDRAPRELNNIDARLKSRFGLWLVCDIKEPDFETRLAILQSKLALKGQHIDDNLLHIIAKHITANVRELEWSLHILLTKRQLSGRPLMDDDMHDCLRTLGYKIDGETKVSMEEMTNLNTNSILNFGTIVDYVAAYYNISSADLKSDKRSQEISRARQMLMVIAKARFHWTLEKIGDYFGGKNHASVIYAIREFPKKIKSDSDLSRDYNIILEHIER